MKNKNCPKCGSRKVKKNGNKNGRQDYKCNSCNHRFQNDSREKSKTEKEMWKEYVFGKQTYEQLSSKYGKSWKTIQRIFDKNIEYKEIFYNENLVPTTTHIAIDVSYFWEDLPVLMIKSCAYKKVIYAKRIDKESIENYEKAIRYIEKKSRKVSWVVADWFKWLPELFWHIPFQMCHFHQVKIITRYLTRNPDLLPNQELLKIALLLKNSNKSIFLEMLDSRISKREWFIKEKTYAESGKNWWYTHKRTRSAYRSLRSNFKYLFVYQICGLPNTTNQLEWYFSPLKTKIWIHTGISKERKIKILWEILSK